MSSSSSSSATSSASSFKSVGLKPTQSEPVFAHYRPSNHDLNNLKMAQQYNDYNDHNHHQRLQQRQITDQRSSQVMQNAQNTIHALEKMSLQEAFETFKFDLIARSRKRQTEIELRARQRQNFIDYERKLAELRSNSARPIKSSCSASNMLQQQKSRENYFEINDVHNKQKRRVMSAHEIKEMTKKNYSKLPEVKQKQVKQRLEQTKKMNLIKSSIYKKVDHVFYSLLACFVFQ